MTTKYFNVKQGLTTGAITLDGTTGNISATNANLGNALIANFFVGDGGFLSNIVGANVTGQVGNALVAGTVYTNAQPNITSVGTLSSLSVTGNIVGGNISTAGLANLGSLTVTGTSNLGPVGNVTITGGSSGQYLQTNGSGVLIWTGVTGIANGTSNIAIPVASGNVNITAGGNTSLVITDTGANVTGTLNATGNANVGNLGTGGLITATGNIGGGNINTGGVVSATGNVSGGNLTTGGVVTATGNVTGANLITAGNVFAPAIVQNASTYDTRIELNSAAGIIQANTNGNVTQFLPGGSIRLPSAGASEIIGGTFDGSSLTLNNNDAIVSQVRGGNVKLQVGTGGTVANTWTFAQDGSFTSPGAISASGNITGANLVTGGLVSATGNANVGNVNTTGVFATTLSSTGNANVGNLGTAGLLTVSGNANVGNLGTNNFIATGTGSFSGNVNMNSYHIVSLATPANPADAATKQYVDDVAQGLHTHDSCNAATDGTLATISGGTVTYNNGASGVGANLTTTGSFTTIDGVTLSNGMRILVKNEANPAHNGIYDRTSSTVLTRSSDFDTPTEMAGGDFTFVTAGTLYDNTGWVMIDVVTTVGTSPVDWVQFSGAGTYTAGTGLTLNGSQFNITNTAVTAGSYGGGDSVASFTVNAQGQLTAASNVAITANAANLTGTTLATGVLNSSLTSVGTLGSLSVTGNIESGNVYANSGTIGASLLKGTLTTAAQPNITSVGTLNDLSATGNIVGGNISTAGLANLGSLTVTGTSNLGPVGNVTITGGSSGYYLQTNGSGVLTWAAVPSGDGIANGTSNVSIPTINGNVNLTAAGNTTLVVTGTGANIAGYANISGNLSAGNITIISSGNISGANNISATTLTGTLTTAAQPNITSVGTLAGLTASSTVDFTTASNVSLGPVGNVKITGGSADQYLKTDGTGNLSWSTLDSSSISNGTSNVNVTLNGNVNVSSAGNANVLVVTGLGANVTGYITASGNITGLNANLGNAVTANYFIGSGNNLSNIQGANVSGAVANATHANTANTVTTAAQPNITSVGTLTTLVVSGNVTANNVALNSGLTSNRTNVAITTNTVIDQFAPSTFRTAKYIISASGDDGYQSVETLLVHDGVNAYITIYGSVCSNNSADIIELSSNINGVSGNVSVYATGTSANLIVNLVSTYINT